MELDAGLEPEGQSGKCLKEEQEEKWMWMHLFLSSCAGGLEMARCQESVDGFSVILNVAQSDARSQGETVCVCMCQSLIPRHESY